MCGEESLNSQEFLRFSRYPHELHWIDGYVEKTIHYVYEEAINIQDFMSYSH